MHLILLRQKIKDITIVDRHKDRLHKASSLYNSVERFESVEDLANQKAKFDLVFVCAFAAQEMNTILKLTNPKGKINLFAGGPWNVYARIIPNNIHYSEIILTGTHSTTPKRLSKSSKNGFATE